MAEPDIFYHREDQWQKPVLSIAPERPDPFLRHMVMRLPEEKQAEFILMVPFTPRGKDNLASWMVARNDGAHYGELVVYRFPKQSLVFGPTQIVNRINQDTEIARQIALWDQGGSQVIRGNLLVIPIEESLIYVMPLYLRAQGGRIPELKRVVVAYQNRVVMEETLDAGLAQLFGGSGAATRAPVRVSETPGAAAAVSARAADLARRANESFRRAVEAQRAGDWARYGEELRRLEDVLRAALDAEAKRQRRSRSFVVSEAIRAYVASREREAFAAGRDQTLREALALSPAARLREAEALWQEFARTHEPGQPWTASFNTFAEYEQWRRR